MHRPQIILKESSGTLSEDKTRITRILRPHSDFQFCKKQFVLLIFHPKYYLIMYQEQVPLWFQISLIRNHFHELRKNNIFIFELSSNFI